MSNTFRVLVMGLPGSGKTTFASLLAKRIGAEHLNADSVRADHGDFDFSKEGRLRQAARMRSLADAQGGTVVADFICPTGETRAAFDPHYVVWMDTVRRSRYPDTDAIFEAPVADKRIQVMSNRDWYPEIDIVASELPRKRPQGVMIGRFQPFHDGHRALFEEALKRHGYVSILVRDTPRGERNPMPFLEVAARIREKLSDYNDQQYGVMKTVNVHGVYYGRDVGYAVERINLPPEIEAISATAIRGQQR